MRQTEHRLIGCDIEVEKVTFEQEDGSEREGFLMVVTDPHGPPTKYMIPFTEEQKAMIVEKLSSGIIPATVSDIRKLTP